jgi:hypothetical protein
MRNPWDGLGASLRRSIGMQSPICGMRIAGRSGFRLQPVDGSVLVALCGDEILFDDSGDDHRAKHAAVARAVAQALLKREGLPVSSDSIEDVARDVLLPLDDFERQSAACDGDLDELEVLHPNVPHAWLADAFDALAPTNVVPLQRVRRHSR